MQEDAINQSIKIEYTRFRISNNQNSTTKSVKIAKVFWGEYDLKPNNYRTHAIKERSWILAKGIKIGLFWCV